ncbi:MAG: hypothetical protein CL908_00895 [Deltaproteobacteria bacterium]|nr:hypothetical protein [Deltaproteobacteria bacterium]
MIFGSIALIDRPDRRRGGAVEGLLGIAEGCGAGDVEEGSTRRDRRLARSGRAGNPGSSADPNRLICEAG